MNKKPGRNDPCPCGSGKKYKQCCLGKETKKTYTPSGKRKFKAKVLSSGNVSQGLFKGATTPQPTTGASTLEKLKVRMTEKDYHKKEEEEELPFALPTSAEEEAPSISKEPPPKPDDTFKPTNEDFREKKED